MKVNEKAQIALNWDKLFMVIHLTFVPAISLYLQIYLVGSRIYKVEYVANHLISGPVHCM